MLIQLHRLLGDVNQQMHAIQINVLIQFVGLRYILFIPMHGTKTQYTEHVVRIWKGAIADHFKVQSRNSNGETVENHDKSRSIFSVARTR